MGTSTLSPNIFGTYGYNTVYTFLHLPFASVTWYLYKRENSYLPSNTHLSYGSVDLSVRQNTYLRRAGSGYLQSACKIPRIISSIRIGNDLFVIKTGRVISYVLFIPTTIVQEETRNVPCLVISIVYKKWDESVSTVHSVGHITLPDPVNGY